MRVSRGQRLTFLAIAAVIAIVAVIVLSGGGGDDEQEAANTGAQATATPTATEAAPDETATETPTPTPTPKQQPPLVTPGKVTKLRFKQGETVRFRVRSDVADHVHVHGYDLFKDVTPGKTITFSFPAEITGIFEIELEDRGEEIAQLRVDPS
jgi:pyruvate/2-oxoglutarate dehydrogenase complex dihydrolipoamide acyltransferase (E2) component